MKTPESFSPIPDRNQVIETIKKLGFENPEAKKLYGKYFDYLCQNAEKITGRGNVEVYIEIAKLYYDSGLIQEAIKLLSEPDYGIIDEARNLGFSDLEQDMWNLVDVWESVDKTDEM
jgi:hypothetical protein